jgi:uncharacterized protein
MRPAALLFGSLLMLAMGFGPKAGVSPSAVADDRAERNVLDQPIQPCSTSPMTGFYRDGCCSGGPQDRGSHTVCARMTAEFLRFSRRRGNDLSTPRPAYNFPGLQPGDSWCLCVLRWKEAYDAGVAPPLRLAATHKAALRVVSLKQLREHALD